MLSRDRPLFVALLAIAFALGLNAVVFFAETSSQRPNGHSDEHTSEIPGWLWSAAEALATGLIAIYAVRQYAESSRSSERQLRAYVEVEIEKFLFGGTETTEIVLKVHNFGLTPAYEVVTNCWVDIRVFPPAPNASYSGPMSMGPGSNATINPQRAIRVKTGTARALNSKELIDVSDGGSRRFYVYGNTSYRDTFGKLRHTDFSFAVQGAPGVPLDVAILPAEANTVS